MWREKSFIAYEAVATGLSFLRLLGKTLWDHPYRQSPWVVTVHKNTLQKKDQSGVCLYLLFVSRMCTALYTLIQAKNIYRHLPSTIKVLLK